MTELPLLAFFMASIYFFYQYLRSNQITPLLLSGFFGLASSLSRYDGWFLVLMQAGLLFVWHGAKVWEQFRKKENVSKATRKYKAWKAELQRLWQETEAKTILFSTLAFVGVLGWMLWDYLILNDPLYFTNSPFSAKSQQQNWLARGELPTYNNLPLSLVYYLVTAYANSGSLISWLAVAGLVMYLTYKFSLQKVVVTLLMAVPVIFYTLTLYIGQSVIFIPQLTPDTFEWQLFNVRYGVMMIPIAAFFGGYLFYGISKAAITLQSMSRMTILGSVWRPLGSFLIAGALLVSVVQYYLFYSGIEQAISYEDGVRGLSAAKRVDAQDWLRDNYDHGLILVDDFARTVSIIRSRLPMERVIYVGTKPWWEESLETPEKHARWIIMQEGDTVWETLNEDPEMQARLYAYFTKVYTSPQILIFQRNERVD